MAELDRFYKLDRFLDNWEEYNKPVIDIISKNLSSHRLICSLLNLWIDNLKEKESYYSIEAYLQYILSDLRFLNEYNYSLINDLCSRSIVDVKELLQYFPECAVCYKCKKDYLEDKKLHKSYITTSLKYDHVDCFLNCFNHRIEKVITPWIFEESIRLEATKCIECIVSRTWDDSWINLWIEDDVRFKELKDKYKK